MLGRQKQIQNVCDACVQAMGISIRNWPHCFRDRFCCFRNRLHYFRNRLHYFRNSLHYFRNKLQWRLQQHIDIYKWVFK